MKDQHTPGPWKCTKIKEPPPKKEFDHLIHTEDMRHVAEVFQYQNHEHNITLGEAAANARLIKAAPEMFTACEAMVHAARLNDPAAGAVAAMLAAFAVAEVEGSSPPATTQS